MIIYHITMQFPEIKYSFEYETVKLKNSLSIAYTESGKGSDTILFIHGIASYMPAWIKNIEGLKDCYRCIAIDLPGYGKSSGGIFPATMSFYAESIMMFIEALALDKVILTGHSMGGQISIQTVLNYPNLFKKLILLASAGFETFTPEEIIEIKRINTVEAFAGSDEHRILYGFTSNFYKAPDDIEFMIRDRLDMRYWPNFINYCNVVINSFHGLLDEPAADRLSEIKQPVFIAYGRNDRFIPVPYIKNKRNLEGIISFAKNSIKHSEIHILDNCGHFLQWEKSNEINQLIRNFINAC